MFLKNNSFINITTDKNNKFIRPKGKKIYDIGSALILILPLSKGKKLPPRYLRI